MIYTISKYRYHVAPVTKEIMGFQVSIWKYDSDQTKFNFEIQFPLESVKDDFIWEDGDYFNGDYRDQMDIGAVMIKDGLLIIGGLKQKGWDETFQRAELVNN